MQRDVLACNRRVGRLVEGARRLAQTAQDRQLCTAKLVAGFPWTRLLLPGDIFDGNVTGMRAVADFAEQMRRLENAGVPVFCGCRTTSPCFPIPGERADRGRGGDPRRQLSRSRHLGSALRRWDHAAMGNTRARNGGAVMTRSSSAGCSQACETGHSYPSLAQRAGIPAPFLLVGGAARIRWAADRRGQDRSAFGRIEEMCSLEVAERYRTARAASTEAEFSSPQVAAGERAAEQ